MADKVKLFKETEDGSWRPAELKPEALAAAEKASRAEAFTQREMKVEDHMKDFGGWYGVTIKGDNGNWGCAISLHSDGTCGRQVLFQNPYPEMMQEDKDEDGDGVIALAPGSEPCDEVPEPLEGADTSRPFDENEFRIKRFSAPMLPDLQVKLTNGEWTGLLEFLPSGDVRRYEIPDGIARLIPGISQNARGQLRLDSEPAPQAKEAKPEAPKFDPHKLELIKRPDGTAVVCLPHRDALIRFNQDGSYSRNGWKTEAGATTDYTGLQTEEVDESVMPWGIKEADWYA